MGLGQKAASFSLEMILYWIISKSQIINSCTSPSRAIYIGVTGLRNCLQKMIGSHTVRQIEFERLESSDYVPFCSMYAWKLMQHLRHIQLLG